ncbi:MAG: pilus assembly protein [Micavibrio aeruginosavorus]|uniref:Pilus assembly protein n=1 Tax=Micavibrio aeruginosavorus TaxID=349221 RepID=A0A2W5FL77_9BACT|nr:MAG: pilus assembly protein [Micavibrio aeruginosavorus]
MRFSHFLRLWKRDEKGSTAIEFSMLSMPFILILVGTMEIGLMFASNSVLDGATNTAARMVRTGQVQQSGGDPRQVFIDKLCEKSSFLLDCSRFQVEVVEMDSFADFSSYAASFDGDGNPDSRGFTPGGVNSVNLVRVFYRYNLATPLIGQFLATGPNNSRMMISTVVLETEPYDLSQVAEDL